MKPTQEQVIAWALEVGLISDAASKSIYDEFTEIYVDGYLLEAAYAAAYEAGRKDENKACSEEAGYYAANSSTARNILDAIRARREQ